ncbi:putative sugar nucleotidyl transferase [Sphingobacterium oryzagri]|uniref:Sugar nucleotidyl transferase n=1 Tax=Sphingobacterium oryzagri TaxID=3025669 RepID=A0ABY7WGA2_9SPHI|nr:putative sugar nucleotidyl transferase [Sphingobacterium sp. KACC 22765]WDF67644.1 putative sugar nucleotidyl transferase [Sphingobacterium sp. KACC 22765]
MLEVVLHDRARWREHLLPLVYTRPVGDLRLGILTLHEKWQHLFSTKVSFYTAPYLQQKFPLPSSAAASYLVIRANILPTTGLVNALIALPTQSVLYGSDGDWLAYHINRWEEEPVLADLQQVLFSEEAVSIHFLEDIYRLNRDQLLHDYALLTQQQTSALLHDSNQVFGQQLFVCAGVTAFGSTFNTVDGPIYLGAGAVIEEGAYLKGPLAICASARVKTGSRLYPNVTIGPAATIAGEVNNAVLWGNCAKGHEGYLGCAVIGEGCNLGAGTSNSNLQNNWSTVKLHDYHVAGLRDTGVQKVGTFMGDYAMCGVNSTITTGNIIGVGAQIAMSNIIPKFVADFCWLTDKKTAIYRWQKFEAMLHARAAIKNEQLSSLDLEILKTVFNTSTVEREEY